MQEPDLIIEVEGGVVNAVYTDLALHVVVNDHDEGVEAGAVAVLPLTPREEARRSCARKKPEPFARGWVDIARTSGGREWLLWVGPLIRARVVTAGDAGRYRASVETVGYLDAAKFASLPDAQRWCEQKITDLLAETRARLGLSRTPGVCSQLFGRRRL